MRKKNGFTLVELLAVIVVLALVLVISIPAIMGTTSDAKKQSFYLYAQSLYSKTVKQYNEDVDNSISAINCKTYNISRDLGISNTGDYKGWVQVKRQATDSDKRNVTISLSDGDGLYHVDYCVDTQMCEPNVGYSIEDDAKNANITESLEEGYYLCVNYSKPVNGELVKSNRVCKSYAEGESLSNSYKYKVIITMSDNSYAVENFEIEGTDDLVDTSQEKKRFYQAIDTYKTNHPNDLRELPISNPVCSNDDEVVTIRNDVANKGTTIITTTGASTRPTTVITTSEATTKPTTVASTHSTIPGQTTVETSGQATTRPSTQVTQNTTDDIRTTKYTTTTVNTANINILLANLVVEGQNIGFEPTKFYYDLTVGNSITSVVVKATKQGNSTIKYEGIDNSGKANLKVGISILKVIVEDNESGASSTYRIAITRTSAQGGNTQTTRKTYNQDDPWDPNSGIPDPTLEESNALLKNIIISGGYKINFEPNVYSYDLVTKGNDMLIIDVIPQVQGCTITIDGNENLSNGGKITITVVSQNGYYSKQYFINITSNVEKSTVNTIITWVTIVLSVILAFLLINILSRQIKSRRVNKEIDRLAEKTAEENRRQYKQEETTTQVNTTEQQTAPTEAVQPVQPQETQDNDNPFNSQG